MTWRTMKIIDVVVFFFLLLHQDGRNELALPKSRRTCKKKVERKRKEITSWRSVSCDIRKYGDGKRLSLQFSSSSQTWLDSCSYSISFFSHLSYNSKTSEQYTDGSWNEQKANVYVDWGETLKRNYINVIKRRSKKKISWVRETDTNPDQDGKHSLTNTLERKAKFSSEWNKCYMYEYGNISSSERAKAKLISLLGLGLLLHEWVSSCCSQSCRYRRIQLRTQSNLFSYTTHNWDFGIVYFLRLIPFTLMQWRSQNNMLIPCRRLGWYLNEDE